MQMSRDVSSNGREGERIYSRNLAFLLFFLPLPFPPFFLNPITTVDKGHREMAVKTLEITGKMMKKVDDATRSSKVDFFSFSFFFFFVVVEMFCDVSNGKNSKQ